MAVGSTTNVPGANMPPHGRREFGIKGDWKSRIWFCIGRFCSGRPLSYVDRGNMGVKGPGDGA